MKIHLHYITLHYITLHYITLHYITAHPAGDVPELEGPCGECGGHARSCRLWLRGAAHPAGPLLARSTVGSAARVHARSQLSHKHH
jgi:hypothetical protein